MSGTQTPVTITSSLFRDYGVSPTATTDLQTLLTSVESQAATALTNATAAQSAAASALTSASTASSAVAGAVASVNAAVTTAEATINSAAATATTTINTAAAGATTAASNAAASSTNATASASAATASAAAASNNASIATASASAASTSAGAANTQATNAASSSTAAAASATTAAGYASSAGTYSASASTSASNAAASAAAAASSAATIGSVLGFRNILINGSMDLWQRGTSLSVTAGSYTADMVQTSHDGAATTSTATRIAVTDAGVLAAGMNYAMAYSGGSSGSDTQTFHQLQFKVENPRTYAGKTVRLTFWAFAGSNITLTPAIAVSAGTGGSPAGGYTTPMTACSVTPVWQQFSRTATLNAASTITPGTNGDGYLVALLGLPINAAFTVNITGVQLELDTGVVTAFERRSPEVELALAQRYCEIVTVPGLMRFSSSTSYGGAAPLRISFAASKWTTPSFTLNTGTKLSGTNGSLIANVSGSNGNSASFSTVSLPDCLILWNNGALPSVNDFTVTGSALIVANL